MKFISWLGKIVVSTVLITAIAMFTTWYVVNMYVEDIFRQYQIPALNQKIQLKDFATRLADELFVMKPKNGGKQAAPTMAPVSPKPAPSSSPSSGETNSGNSTTQAPSGSAGANAKGASEGIKDDAVAVMGRAHTDAAEPKREIVMSTEQFAKKKEALSSDDKMKIFLLLLPSSPKLRFKIYRPCWKTGSQPTN
ncbi:hypothetical protein [Paenibacillus sp. N3.4]|uniref:hypothetical protein n=1 Tax=Paenibacillus sp. N3.4 TaxID=2603222 RepID=UPI0011C739E9|nr:hypothetical protein [Paenibacillus sp. N3.4]TXK77728.1 hypothetical protein FU659_21855 [Paenibacillus sp. N3.4]